MLDAELPQRVTDAVAMGKGERAEDRDRFLAYELRGGVTSSPGRLVREETASCVHGQLPSFSLPLQFTSSVISRVTLQPCQSCKMNNRPTCPNC